MPRNNVTFEHAAAAEAAGFRACLRCRPYRVAGPVGSDAPELVCRAVQLIIGGALDHDGTEEALAARVGLSARHLRRLFLKHLGASPDQLARSRRAHFARRLLDDTDLTVLDVAFASGFGSLRQFNRAIREVFRASPTDLRDRRRRADRLVADGGLALRLPFLPGYDWPATLGLLSSWAVPGVESVEGETYRRTITVKDAPGLLEISPGGADHLLLRAHLPYWEDLIHVVDRASRIVGLDTDHSAGVEVLSDDPVLGPLVRSRPGLAVPGAWSGYEVATQVVLGSGLADFVASRGSAVPGLPGGLTHTFPLPSGEFAVLEPGIGVAAVAALPGLDVEQAHRVAFRLGCREAFPTGEPALAGALAELGVSPATRWHPWSALAAAQLMAASGRTR